MSKVALIRCETYESADVFAAVNRAIDLIGGAGAIATRTDNVLLKPSVMQGRSPELCVTTHPAVFEAAASVFKSTDASLFYGDAPAVGGSLEHLEKAGIRSVAERLSLQLADFDHGVEISHPEATIQKNFIIAQGVLACTVLVSISKLKTHDLFRITGAVKNQYGCIPGLIKAHYHSCLPDTYKFAQFLVDINTFVKPKLFIMDAIYAMEGNGPQSGDPKKLGCILVSTDPVALDAVACRLINLNPLYVPTCLAGEKAGLGTCADDKIEIVGENHTGFIDKKFRVVRRPSYHFSGFASKLRARKIFAPRITIKRKNCTRCGKCILICPIAPKALSWKKNDKKDPPRYNYLRCIRCFCCQEICPSKAIKTGNSVAGVIFAKILHPLSGEMAAPLVGMKNKGTK
jgi:uncharacterized protein (DUF362 family)/Pyruvate/2-oxoacid:ferredoxin oxidoreductase delta subunit